MSQVVLICSNFVGNTLVLFYYRTTCYGAYCDYECVYLLGIKFNNIVRVLYYRGLNLHFQIGRLAYIGSALTPPLPYSCFPTWGIW